jgi:ParB family transcriptional regulator, chromosome partitioning protein
MTIRRTKMIAEKRALGRGLSALISENLKDIEAQVAKTIPMALVAANPYQPRRNFDALELQQLASSIQENGVLQPILVREKDGGYQIIAGERRWRASSIAGLKDIPAVTIKVDDKKMLEIAIIENVQRQNLNPIEEANAYKSMLDELGYKQEEVEYISNMVRLLKLPEDVQRLVCEGKISMGHARAIVNTENPSNYIKQILDNNLSVRDTESLVKDLKLGAITTINDNTKDSKSKAFKTFDSDCDIGEVSKIIEDELGMKVKIIDSKYKGGEVRISFLSYEQLDFLMQKLCGDKLNF